MDKHERTMRISSVGEDGVFEMTLATEGEASDGDILSIAGGQIPARMPLLLSHFNDPTAIAGSVTNPRKDLKAKPPELRSTGQIEMGGVGVLADVRRDVAFMTAKHGGAVSIRWDALEGGDPPIRRVNLPSDHPHFVDFDTEKSDRKRWGMFWPSWKAMEGSIVALGADPGATIDGRLCAQRAEETEGEVAAFWRAMAKDAEEPLLEPGQPGIADAMGVHEDAEIEKIAADGSEELSEELREVFSKSASDLLADINAHADVARDEGATIADLVNAVALEGDGNDFTTVTIGDEQVFLPQRLADQLAAERVERAETPAQKPKPDPESAQAREDHPSPETPVEALPALDASAFGKLLSEAMDEYDERMLRNVGSLLDSHTGKV